MGGEIVKNCIKEVKNLEKKAGLSREICAYQHRKYKRITNLLSLIILLSSTFIALLSVADPAIMQSLPFLPLEQQVTRNIVALLGFFVLVASFSDKVLGLTKAMNESEQGMKLLTEFIRDCHTFRDVWSKDCDEIRAGQALKSTKKQYNHLNQILSPNSVSNLTFLRIKKAYKQKVQVSKMLDDDPDINIREHYSMRLWD